jgi:hypothetical protein
MGFDLYAIKNEHWEKYEYNTLSILDEIEDDWYIDQKYDYSHGIWHSWREGYYEDTNYEKIILPKELKMFYFEINDTQSASDMVEKLTEFINKNDECGEIKSFIEWLKYWIFKEASFYLCI